MLGHKLFGSGLNGLAVASIGLDVESGITATGTNAATAYSMTAAMNEFTTVAAGTGAILYSGAVGDSQYVYNGGANQLSVYPSSGCKINALPTDQAALLPSACACEFTRVSSTRFSGMLSR